MALVVKDPPANPGGTRDAGSVPGSGRSPGGGHSILAWRIPTDRGARWAMVHRVAKGRTRLKRLTTHARVLVGGLSSSLPRSLTELLECPPDMQLASNFDLASEAIHWTFCNVLWFVQVGLFSLGRSAHAGENYWGLF